LITGQHGVNSGIDQTPDLLDTATTTLQRHLSTADQTASYETAVIGKWHLAGGNTSLISHPTDSGVDYYTGTIDNYFSWPLTQNGATQTSSSYHTTALTEVKTKLISYLSARAQ
jgi:arylsulfatase A-like enzyme